MSAHTPAKALSELVTALNTTNWSSWQSIANFSPALAVAQVALDRERVRDAAPDLLEALKAIKDHPNTRYEVEAQLGESTWNAIAKAEGAAS